jgi:hypothetical protein
MVASFGRPLPCIPVKRRAALVAVLGAFVVLVPASASADRVPTALAPVARLLCGCDPLVAARATAVTVTARVSTVSMSIVHVVRGCHVWALGSRQLGPSGIVTVKPGTKLKLRITCPMDFDLVQLRGPKVALGGTRFYAGTTRVVIFKKAGVYRFAARNVQTSDEVGLETLGDDNSLRLTIRVR